MKWENFAHHFDKSYSRFFKAWIESSDCDEVYTFLKNQSQKGKQICPDSTDVFRCFKDTPLDKLKAVMIGMCPYHTIRDRIPIADGLLMSCSKHSDYLAPSLEQFYGGLEEEFKEGLCLPCLKNNDLSYLARQGILMFNAALTTEAFRAGSHNEKWEFFTKFVFEDIIAPSGVPVIFFGREASKFIRYLAPLQWYFELPHPASAAYKGTQWKTEGVFSKVNKIVKDANGESIYWLEELEPAPF